MSSWLQPAAALVSSEAFFSSLNVPDYESYFSEHLS